MNSLHSASPDLCFAFLPSLGKVPLHNVTKITAEKFTNFPGAFLLILNLKKSPKKQQTPFDKFKDEVSLELSFSSAFV